MAKNLEKINGWEDYKPIDIDYTILLNHFWGESVIKDSYKFWDKLGFIEGMKKQKAEECSIAYDNLTYMFEHGYLDKLSYLFKDMFDIDFEVMAYPLIRRIIEHTSNFDIDDFLEYLEGMDYEMVEDVLDEFNLLAYDSTYHKDYDVELTDLLSKIIVAKFNNLED